MENKKNLNSIENDEHYNMTRFKDKINSIFKKSFYTNDDIYEMLYQYVSIEKNKYSLIELRNEEIKKKNLQANEEIKYLSSIVEKQEKEIINQRKIIEDKENEIIRLHELLNEEDKNKSKLFEYLEKVALILQNNQKKIINRKKPTKADFIAESMYKIEKETKEKLK